MFSRQHQPSAVMHFAASIVVADSVAQPIPYYENNTVNTLRLLKVCSEFGTDKIIFSSTAAVYGETDEKYISETTLPCPKSPYGRSKLADEWIINDVSQAESLSYVILRYFNVAGASSNGLLGQRSPNATHLIKRACEAALIRRKKLTLFGDDYDTDDGTCVRDYIHVEDLASAHLKALNYLEREGKSITLNCGYSRGYSVKEVVNTLNGLINEPISFEIGARRAGDLSSVVAKSDLIREVLGWQPQYEDLASIIASSYKWEKMLYARRENSAIELPLDADLRAATLNR